MFGVRGTFNEVHNLVRTPFRCVVMYLCVRNLLALVMIMLSLISLIIPVSLTMCSPPSSSPKYYLDVPIDNCEICDSNVDLGYEDNTLNMLGGILDNFLSLGYFSGCDASNPYYIYLVDKPKKSYRPLSLLLFSLPRLL